MSGMPTVVCPFCPLHCDDIPMESMRRGQTGCSTADARVRQCDRLLDRDPHPNGGMPEKIDSEKVGLRTDEIDRLKIADLWIRQARRIVIDGTIVDLETARAVAGFVGRHDANVRLDGLNDRHTTRKDCIAAGYRETFARDGGFTATIGEAIARDAAVTYLGDVDAAWPRLRHRLRRCQASPFVELQDPPDGAADLSAGDAIPLPERLASIRRELIQCGLDAFADAARRYQVFVVAPSLADDHDPLLIWSSLFGLIRQWNGSGRAALLSLDNSMTARSVMAWNGIAVRGESDCDDPDSLVITLRPWGDCESWIADQPPLTPDPRPSRRIVIGNGIPTRGNGEDCIELPASVPGVHRDGVVIRGDGSVTLPLTPWRPDGLPSPASYFQSWTRTA